MRTRYLFVHIDVVFTFYICYFVFINVFFFRTVTTADGQVKIVKNVVVPNQVITGAKNTLTSLLTTNSNKLAGRRILMTKAADGTTRVIAGATNILPKGSTPQSLIKVQPGQQVQIQTQGMYCLK